MSVLLYIVYCNKYLVIIMHITNESNLHYFNEVKVAIAISLHIVIPESCIYWTSAQNDAFHVIA